MASYNSVLELLNQPIQYSARAKREMKRAHFTEEMLIELLKHPQSVFEEEEGFRIRGRKTAKVHLKVLEGKAILITSFSYNPVPFVF